MIKTRKTFPQDQFRPQFSSHSSISTFIQFKLSVASVALGTL